MGRPFSSNPDRRERFRCELYEKQNGNCHLCGDAMTLVRRSRVPGREGPMFATFDHVKPVRERGGNAQRNIKLAHKRCNTIRGHRPVVDAVLELDPACQ